MTWFSSGWWLSLLLFLSGCALDFGSGTATSTHEFSFDGVKLISRSVARGDDTSTYGQSTYTLDGDRRLLLRFESLGEHVSNADVRSGRAKVWVRVSLSSGDPKSLRLYGLTRSWMMLATWNFAHPFGPAGRWTNAGGDLDAANVMTPTEVRGPHDEGGVVQFDATRWFIDYPQGRSVNYGFALISDGTVAIEGEAAGSLSPRLVMDKYVKGLSTP
jgi:hypothetical protein